MEYTPSDLKRFEALLTGVATTLIGICSTSGVSRVETILDDLIDNFSVEAVFLRRLDHSHRHSTLVASRISPTAEGRSEARLVLDHIDFDAHPAGNAAENQTEPVVITTDQLEAGDRHIPNSSGFDGTTMVTVPLLHGSRTIGVLGMVDATDRTWHEHELRTLSTIATLFAHQWSRLDAEEQLAYQVHYDELTGLPNRRYLAEVIEGLREDRKASLLIIDVDNMKVINDGLDFETGNRFIAELGKRLVSSVRPNALIARLSGDQFAILVVDTPPGQVERLAKRLVSEMAETVDIDEDFGLARSVSIGVAHNYIADTNPELLAEADAALHQAKRSGKKRMAVFDEAMRAKLIDSFEVEIELRRALENNELTLHYQPEVDLGTGRICAVEALLRWNHPTRGLLTAGAFIETAEESGLVVDIGDQVLRQAIAQLADWQDDHPDLEMWINVSPAQLMSRDVATQVQRLLNEFDVRPQRVCLEVTEHVVLGDLDATTGILRRIRDMGIKLALDDFGTGYSSMKQLKQLPITALKIDMAFVAGLGVSDHDSAIVDAAINLAAAFDLGTVAEGVETHQQITELRRRGCQVAQGFLLAEPAAPDRIAELLGKPLGIEQPA